MKNLIFKQYLAKLLTYSTTLKKVAVGGREDNLCKFTSLPVTVRGQDKSNKIPQMKVIFIKHRSIPLTALVIVDSKIVCALPSLNIIQHCQL